MTAQNGKTMAIVEVKGEGFKVNFSTRQIQHIALERAKMKGRLFRMERSTPLTIRRLAAIEEALCHRLAGEIEEEGTEGFDYHGALDWAFDQLSKRERTTND